MFVGCGFLNDKKECSVYENRPEICRVDSQYQKVKNLISQEDWYKLEKECCSFLRGKLKWMH